MQDSGPLRPVMVFMKLIFTSLDFFLVLFYKNHCALFANDAFIYFIYFCMKYLNKLLLTF